MKVRKMTYIALVAASLVLLVGLVIRISHPHQTAAQEQAGITIEITPTIPKDITGSATVDNAAAFAWQEFIALNWPAVKQTGGLNQRDRADTQKFFGDQSYADASNPLVWHTFRSKVEIYPGTGVPNGYTNSAEQSYGYDALPCYQYVNPVNFCAPNTSIAGSGTAEGASATAVTPWINLDENSEIGLNHMYAGVANTGSAVGQQILFLAKANRAEYNYVAAQKWWAPARFDSNNNLTFKPIINTKAYIAARRESLPAGSTILPGSTAPGVSLPNGTIEVKSAWRELTSAEIASGRFYTTTVRHYENIPGTQGIAYKDSVFGMVGLHIIQKTPTSPFFIFATFSQADNLLDASGNPVEDPDGNPIPGPGANSPFDPNIQSINAQVATSTQPYQIQQLLRNDKRLYFKNIPDTGLPSGSISLNQRKHLISPAVIHVNRTAHTAIQNYNRLHNLKKSPWEYYKLVSVQFSPYNKAPGITYTGTQGGPDAASYYQANEVIESDYNLQVFSGQFQPQSPTPIPNSSNLITDYAKDGKSTFHNVYYKGSGYLMGGCMGCHGNAQVAGSDFSFIFLGGPVTSPDTVGEFTPTSIQQGHQKFARLLQSHN